MEKHLIEHGSHEETNRAAIRSLTHGLIGHMGDFPGMGQWVMGHAKMGHDPSPFIFNVYLLES